jgi:hypothetical protein
MKANEAKKKCFFARPAGSWFPQFVEIRRIRGPNPPPHSITPARHESECIYDAPSARSARIAQELAFDSPAPFCQYRTMRGDKSQFSSACPAPGKATGGAA